MKFEYPMFSVLLAGVPLIAWLQWYLWDYRKKAAELLRLRGRDRSATVYAAKSIALAGGWALLVLAMMGPLGNPRYIGGGGGGDAAAERQKPQDIVFLIDTSASMDVKDGRSKTSRLETAKELAELLIQNMKGQNVALYAFTSEATPLSPPTPDYLFTILALRDMKINEGEASGTDLYEALDVLIKQYGDDNPEKRHTLVLMSDGGDNSLDDEASNMPKVLGQVKRLKDKGWHFVIVGVGSLEGGEVPGVEYQGKKVISKLDERLLRKIAEAGHGEYYRSNDGSLLEKSEMISKAITRSRQGQKIIGKTPQSQVSYERYFQIPLLLGMLLLLFAGLYPDSRSAAKPHTENVK